MNSIERKALLKIIRQISGFQNKLTTNDKIYDCPNRSLIKTSKLMSRAVNVQSLLSTESFKRSTKTNISKLRNSSSVAVPATAAELQTSTLTANATTTKTTTTQSPMNNTTTTRSSSLMGQDIIMNNTDEQQATSSIIDIRKNLRKFQKINLNILNENENILPFDKIPAAKGLPLIGTHLDFIAAGSAQQLHKYIHKRHKQLGPIFRECLGGTQDAVFVASPNLMRTVFNYEGQYPTHPLPESWNLYNKKYNCRRGLFFMNGPEWLQNRRKMNKLLLNGNCNWINQHIHKSTSNLIEEWREKYRNKKFISSSSTSLSSSYVELNNLEVQLYKWSIDVLTSIMFGKTITEFASETLLNEIEIFSNNVQKIFESSSSLMSFPPKLAQILKLKIWKDFETNVTDVLEMGNNVIDRCINEFGYGNGLLAKMIESQMSMDDIRRIFVDLIIAAGDTTAHSTHWALYLLGKIKHIQETARNDLNYSDVKDEESQYIKGLIKETLRLYPVAPFIGRFLACNANIGNYHIDKDTLVLLSLYTSGRDEKSFPNALSVCPERWYRKSNGELENVLNPNASIPFAMGIRSCIGKKIALTQMYSLIAQMVTNFDISCLNDSNVDVILRMVAVPNQPIHLLIREL